LHGGACDLARTCLWGNSLLEGKIAGNTVDIGRFFKEPHGNQVVIPRHILSIRSMPIAAVPAMNVTPSEFKSLASRMKTGSGSSSPVIADLESGAGHRAHVVPHR
jgi:hypothetical protein